MTNVTIDEFVPKQAFGTTALSVVQRWLVVLALVVILPVSTAQARGAPDSFADLAERLLPTVVNISTSQKAPQRQGGPSFEDQFREFFERREGSRPNRPRRINSLGSGFIIDKSGTVVTNHHVIAGADEITIRLHDNTIHKAEVVGSDESTDVAVLKVVDLEGELPAETRWGDSNETRIGDWVMAIGNPFGLGGTVTAGIVSARQRDIQSGPYDNYIQTDASINRGNSGGPMFNLDGEVIGINTAIFSPTGGSVGIGFAVPSSMAKNVVAQLRQFGEVRRGWLGVRIQTVTEELAEGLRLDEAYGALVASVTPGGPAEAAGIQQGDVVLEFDGQKVEEMRKLPRMVADTPIGKEVAVTVWRKMGSGDYERVNVEVVLGQLDIEQVAALSGPETSPQSSDAGDVPALGLALAKLSPALRDRFELDEKTNGVVITDVDGEGSAAEKDLRPGDVIVEVDQEEVLSPEEVADRVKQAKDKGFSVVTLLVFRSGDFRWVAVRLGES